MKKRYYLGTVLVMLPVIALIIIITGVLGPAPAGAYARVGIGSFIAFTYGISLIRTAYQMGRRKDDGYKV